MRHGGFWKNGRCHYGRVDVDPAFRDGSSTHTGLLEHHHEANQGAGQASSSSSSGRNCLPLRKLWSELRGYALAILAKPNDVKGQLASKNNEADKEKSSRDDSRSSGSVKKHEREGPAAATVRMEATKLRLGDKITTLHQIVSPFGKSDTASVLLETVTYIKFLQDQVRLLASGPCSNANTHKDLRSKGLCLVPVSGSSWVYDDDMGSAILSKP